MSKTFADFGIHISHPRQGWNAIPCPRCVGERTKKSAKPLSVHVGPEGENFWKCHHCGFSGSLGGGESSKGNPNRWKAEEWSEPENRGFKPGQGTVDWFKKERGISAEVLTEAGILFHERIWMPQIEDFVPAIGFPFYRQGKKINVQWRDLQKHFRFEAGCELIFWGLDHIIDANKKVIRDVYITEGMMDALALMEAGYHGVMSVPNGAPKSSEKDPDSRYKYIAQSNYKLNPKDELGVLDQVTQFFICVDNDEPGQALERQLVKQLGAERCLRVKWEPYCECNSEQGCKDANDILKRHGAEAVRRAIEGARREPMKGIVTFDDIDDKLMAFYHGDGLKPGLSLGWSSFKLPDGKEIYTVERGLMTGILGIPGMGKSVFVENMIIRMMNMHGWKFGAYVPEAMPFEYNASQLIEKHLKQSFSKHTLSEKELLAAKEYLRTRYFWIGQEDGNYTIDDILIHAEKLVRREGIDGLLIDPWNKLDHSRPRKEFNDSVEYLGYALSEIKKFCWKHWVHAWIVAHPSKMEPLPDGSYPVPRPYNFAGGAMFFNMLDCILVPHYNKAQANEAMQIHAQKIKRRHLGALGYARLAFSEHSGNLYDTDIPAVPGSVGPPPRMKKDPETKKKKEEQTAMDWGTDDKD